jgi:Rrf2 family protein
MSAGVEWALHCTVLLAVLKPTSTLPGRALAQFHGVSESYLLKHMQALTKAGICESVSGPTGGYRLARQPGEITLLDVFEAIEGTEPAFRCDEIRQRGPTALAPCTYTVRCGIHGVMIEAVMAWRQALQSRTIADLTPVSIETMHPQRVELATRWIHENVRRTPDETGPGGSRRDVVAEHDATMWSHETNRR